MRWQKGIWSSIEVVITSTTGNRVAAKTARGFESLLLRQKGWILGLPFVFARGLGAFVLTV